MSGKTQGLGIERRVTRPSPLFAAGSALALVMIACATFCPIQYRPHFAAANHERFAAYFALAFLLALTFRRRWATVAAVVVLLAVAMEAGQALVPTRDPRLADAVVKALGGLLGSGAGYAVFPSRRALLWAARRLTPALAPAPLRPEAD